MTVEHGQRYATNHQGQFEDLLVQTAREAGVSEFYVWSPRDADFAFFTTETVTELE